MLFYLLIDYRISSRWLIVSSLRLLPFPSAPRMLIRWWCTLLMDDGDVALAMMVMLMVVPMLILVVMAMTVIRRSVPRCC